MKDSACKILGELTVRYPCLEGCSSSIFAAFETLLTAYRNGVPVHVQNDANACALAEYRFGAGRGTRNMVFMTFGTGLGAGIVIDGKLYSGTNDNAGEIGHIRLAPSGPVGYNKEGSAEGFCSGA